MGQYYRPLVISGKTMKVFNSFDYDNGQKLMEHSYLGNRFMNAVFSEIYNNPCRVAWIGDYSNDSYGDPYEQIMPHERFMKYYNKAWNARKFAKTEPLEYTGGGYLVNHTKKVYIDLRNYETKCSQKETWKDLDGVVHVSKFCINPLSLLTACGNGRGGGDYHDCYPGYKDVGSWAFDKIEFTNEKPEGYQSVMYEFREEAES